MELLRLGLERRHRGVRRSGASTARKESIESITKSTRTRFFIILTIKILAIVSAYMCNCYDFENPKIVVARHLGDVHSSAFCHDVNRDINSFIPDHTVTDAECARAYSRVVGTDANGRSIFVPDTRLRANCEHWTGGCL
ncbi:hypothetical protein COCVIDRAFT_17093 [Bipolaris victoriae FI3]|uniref:Uncharacterized protein n=1 Tax=Bipolaris victoriae (strain FI3) TaxID=930091 RepID=W7EJ19_BIPV3|nr:hypothetical protein COCVIDRAFT_17093 [Bipolaris victoriae FI3]